MILDFDLNDKNDVHGMMIVGFPNVQMRRLGPTLALSALTTTIKVNSKNLVQPLFIDENGSGADIIIKYFAKDVGLWLNPL